MRAVTRLLSAAADLQGPDVVRRRLVSEARDFFDVMRAVLLELDATGERLEAVASNPGVGVARRPLAVAELAPLELLLAQSLPALLAQRAEAQLVDRALGFDGSAETVLMLPMRAASEVHHVLLLLDSAGREFSEAEVGVAGSFAAAAAASLAQMRLGQEHAEQVAQQAALARAAKTLNESLDLNRVLVRICDEAASILDGDNAAIFRGDADGLTIEAVHGIPPEAIGQRVAAGVGLSGRVVQLERPLITNDYQRLEPSGDSIFGDVRSCVAVPMHWDGKLRGVLAVGYHRRYRVTRDEMKLLEAFGELAAAACRNASAHAGLAELARTDGLTGCLNHTAMQHMLRREIDRCERTGHRLSLILIDLDEFKAVNEEHGHLAGDDVLRRVGRALRGAVRPYDLVARYGGDEFAVVALEADERAAGELAQRALDGIGRALAGDEALAAGGGGASAGVAEWEPGQSPAAVIANADRALLHGKQRGGRGSVISFAGLPPAPRSPAPPPPAVATAFAAAGEAAWPDQGREQTERLRIRTRQLSLANELGARLAAMTDQAEILDAAVDELHRAFGYFLCAIVRIRDDGYVEAVARRGKGITNIGVRAAAQPRAAGVIGRCLRERRPVIAGDVREEPDYVAQPGAEDVRAELVVPLLVGDRLWGAIDVEEVRPHAFDADDARLVQTVAGQVGAALRLAMLSEQLERAARSGHGPPTPAAPAGG